MPDFYEIIRSNKLKSGLEFLTDWLSDVIFAAVCKYIQTLTF